MAQEPNDWVDVDDWQDVTPNQPVQESGGFWDTIRGVEDWWNNLSVNQPLTDAPSEFARSVSSYIPEDDSSNPFGIDFLKRFGRGAINTIGDFGTEMTSPTNLALTAASLGSGTAARYGLKGATKGLSLAEKVLSAPLALEGTANMLDPESSLGERGLGLVEAAGGGAGMLHSPKIREIGKRNLGPIGGIDDLIRDTPDVPLGDIELPEPHPTPNLPKDIKPYFGIPDEVKLIDATVPEIIPPTKDTSPEAWKEFVEKDLSPNTDIAAEMAIDEAKRKLPNSELIPFETGVEEVTAKYDKGIPIKDAINSEFNLNTKPKITYQGYRDAEKAAGRVPVKYADWVNGKAPTFKQPSLVDIVADAQTRPDSISLDTPTPELVDIARSEGYVPSGVADANGAPVLVQRELTLELPKYLAGARPRFNFGKVPYTPVFTSDLDKALYIVAQETPSKHNDAYLKWIFDETGMDSNAAVAAGKDVRSKIKGILKGAPEGDIEIPVIHRLEVKPISTEVMQKLSEGKPLLPNEKLTPKQVEEQIKFDELIGSDGTTVPPKPPRRIPPSSGGTGIPKVPQEPPKPHILRELYELPRGLMSTDLPFITSAPLRQAMPLFGTKNWFKAFGKSIDVYKSEDVFKAMRAKQLAHPLMVQKEVPVISSKGNPVISKFTGKPRMKKLPSIADKMGINFSELTNNLKGRDEFSRSTLAERIPVLGWHYRANNRQTTYFLNELRLTQADTLIKSAEAAGLKPLQNDKLLRDLGTVINTATGRPSLILRGFKVGKFDTRQIKFEDYAKVLSDIMWSPRLLQRNIEIFNPFYYTQMDDFARNEATKNFLRTAAGWSSFASLGWMAGGQVSFDPTNSDFLKVKYGNTRLDPGAGIQQVMVLAARNGLQEYTSSNDPENHVPFGEKSYPNSNPAFIKSSGSITGQFASNKLNPVVNFFTKMAYAKGYGTQFNVLDETAQMAAPMFLTSVWELARTDPDIAAMIIGPAAILGSAGAGIQSYSPDEDFNEPTFIPEEYDYVMGQEQ